MNKKIKIFVVSHSPEEIVKISGNDMFTPLFVGRNGRDNLGFLSDDTGDEISAKNPHYCELTGLYWMWKNTDADIIGLCHYRRHFKSETGGELSGEDIINYLNDYDIVLPKPNTLVKGTYWETYKNHYFGDALHITRDVLSDLFPDYLKTFDNVLNQGSFHNYNMFICDKKLADEYCLWIFEILKEVESRINLDEYPRVLGLISEAILNVWVEYHGLKVKELEVSYLGFSLKLRMWISHNILIRKTYSFLYRYVLRTSVGENIDKKMTNRYNKL